MARVGIKTFLDATGFRSGLNTLKAEGERFRAQFRRGIESGGGLFGAVNQGLGSLASGRLAAPIAAVGAALIVARAASQQIANYWESVAESTRRAARDAESIRQSADAQVSSRVAGESANRDLERRLAAARAEEEDLNRNARNLKDPRSILNVVENVQRLNPDGSAASKTLDALRLIAGSFGIGSAQEDATQEFDRQEDARQAARERRRNLEAQVQRQRFDNSQVQVTAEDTREQARDRRRVTRGELLESEATAAQLEREKRRLDAMRAFFNDDTNPAVIQQEAKVVQTAGQLEQQVMQQQRFRNDPMISADDLTRVGGGGGVGVFGDGQGQMLVETRRTHDMIARGNEILQGIHEVLLRGSGSETSRGGERSPTGGDVAP
jgi:hypothetical protein